MLYRAAIRFFIMIIVLAGIRLGACAGPVRHTNEGPLPVSSHADDAQDAEDAARDTVRQPMRERSTRDSFADSDNERDRDDRGYARDRREMTSEELIRALAAASRERRQAQYRPGEPMSNAEPMSDPTPSN